MKIPFFVLGVMLVGNIAVAAPPEGISQSAVRGGRPAITQIDHQLSDALDMAIALEECQILLEMSSRRAANGATYVSRYQASNRQLHMCEYMQEMDAESCLSTKRCPTYRRWTAKNKSFSPKLPRATFMSMLENRRNMIDAITTSSERKRAAHAAAERSGQANWIQVSEDVRSVGSNER